MTTQSDDSKSIEQLRKERNEFFPPPRSVGDSVVTAFVLGNLSSLKKLSMTNLSRFKLRRTDGLEIH